MIFSKFGMPYDKFEDACYHYKLVKETPEETRDVHVVLNNLRQWWKIQLALYIYTYLNFIVNKVL